VELPVAVGRRALAVIRPFQAVVYAHEPGDDVSSRTAPPYDVIDDVGRAALLARDPHNIVALELPHAGDSADKYQTAASLWRAWRAEGVLTRDASEAFYVLEQTFMLDGCDVRRRALIAALELEPFSAGIVLPHERTLPKTLDDRLNLTRACEANFSQVFGMFSDPDHDTDAIFDGAVEGAPLLTARGDEGVVSTVWAVRDPALRALAERALADRQVYIADGHHRYTTALAYRDERRSAAGGEGEAPAYDSIMMALVNMDDPDLVVLPTHRAARVAGEFDPESFFSGLARAFDVRDVRADEVTRALASAEMHTMAVRAPASGRLVLATPKPDALAAKMDGLEASAAWKDLDVAIVQELVLDPLLDIHPDRPETLDRLAFIKGDREALAVDGHDVVVLVRPTRMDQLREVATGGEIMPQKSTYFYPKLLSGLLMRSLA
jgi:uncharacterized protein (DUF1015 family)